MRHPAMLLYLDNAGSAGPHSMAGRRRHAGLNENLAAGIARAAHGEPGRRLHPGRRDELRRDPHRLVLARDDDGAGFMFRPALHEPGGKTLMGRSFPEGEEGGLAGARLPRRPSGHAPPSRDQAGAAFRRGRSAAGRRRADRGRAARHATAISGAAALALVDAAGGLAAARQAAQPRGLCLSRCCARPTCPPRRAADLDPAMSRALGQPPWTAAFPIGWPDTAAEWAGPEEMVRRVDWAYAFAGPRRGTGRRRSSRRRRARPVAAARRRCRPCSTPARAGTRSPCSSPPPNSRGADDAPHAPLASPAAPRCSASPPPGRSGAAGWPSPPRPPTTASSSSSCAARSTGWRPWSPYGDPRSRHLARRARCRPGPGTRWRAARSRRLLRPAPGADRHARALPGGRAPARSTPSPATIAAAAISRRRTTWRAAPTSA